ncbi:MAG: hypothetical protein IJJ77_08425 [Paludibacteraceae bacterium]|nr:hypothetical protein [Paludibacteraceae bacterium]
MLKVLCRWEINDKYGRHIHPGFILMKLLCDSDLDYYITNHELSHFTTSQSFMTDEQYDEIKQYILDFRKQKFPYDQDWKRSKSDIFLSTFDTNWGLLTRNTRTDTLNERDYKTLLAQWEGQTNPGTDDDDTQEDTVDKDSSLGVNAFIVNECRLNGLAAYVARLYLSLLEGIKVRDYLSYFSSSNKKNAEINFSKQFFYKASSSEKFLPYLTVLHTKPFVLLAGISGTGKSRIVRELAKASVTEELQQKYDSQSVANGFDRRSLHKPANFELVQVKPNWHNSLEVVGYKSNIGGPHYEFTPFVEFVARAWKNPTVPFFLCLDEMNLAPVEQYFAEFLSAIESRSIENGEYETDPIVKPFAEFGDEVCNDMLNHLVGSVDAANVRADSLEAKLVERFKTKGLTLPPNLLVLGTVNMDETTFSFSRKVLDRAMSIVMNDVEYDSFFSGESENTVDDMDDNMRDWLIRRPIRGLDVAEGDDLNAVKEYLKAINEKLDNTPFKLGYRAANEALLYVSAARQLNAEANINVALDEFTLMKILSRIEGDKRSIGDLLDNLQSVITDVYPKSHAKLNNMKETLNCKQFVSYWT